MAAVMSQISPNCTYPSTSIHRLLFVAKFILSCTCLCSKWTPVRFYWSNFLDQWRCPFLKEKKEDASITGRRAPSFASFPNVRIRAKSRSLLPSCCSSLKSQLRTMQKVTPDRLQIRSAVLGFHEGQCPVRTPSKQAGSGSRALRVRDYDAKKGEKNELVAGCYVFGGAALTFHLSTKKSWYY